MTAELTRVELLVWCLIEDFHKRHGVDADNVAGVEYSLLIWKLSDCHAIPRLAPFEEILGNFEEIHRLESDEVSVWDRAAEREVHQHDADYCTVRAEEVAHLKDTITAQIRALLA